MLTLTHKELDAQCTIQLDGWVELGSERFLEVDDDPALTKKWLKMLLGEGLFTDSLGRVWGKGDTNWYPYHVQYGKKKFGIRISTKAVS
jgi:hypothetical protein